MQKFDDIDNYYEKRLFLGLLLSLGLHICLFSIGNLKKIDLIPESKPLEIKIDLNSKKEELVPIKTNQIVTPSDIKTNIEPVETNLRSDVDTSFEKQTIKKGQNPPGPAKQEIKKEVKKIAQPEKKIIERNQTNKKLDVNNLLLNQSELINEENQLAKNKEVEAKKTEESRNKDLISKFGSAGSFSGNGGSSDYLPDVLEGDLTLLNAKADRFSVFVRRVALKVFDALKSSNWSDDPQLSRGIQTDQITIIAVLDQKGKFISAQINESSGLKIFDGSVLAAVRKGAWDQNPPPQAKSSDGTIRFIFQSKAWVRGGGTGRARQWILLGTGLE